MNNIINAEAMNNILSTEAMENIMQMYRDNQGAAMGLGAFVAFMAGGVSVTWYIRRGKPMGQQEVSHLYTLPQFSTY